MLRLHAGVEGGGTSTTVVVSMGDQILGTESTIASNPFLLGKEPEKTITKIVSECVLNILSKYNESKEDRKLNDPKLYSMVMTMSGYGRKHDAIVLEEAIIASGLAKHCVVAGDSAGSLECLHSWLSVTSSTQEPSSNIKTTQPSHGIVLISGTGSACFRYDLKTNQSNSSSSTSSTPSSSSSSQGDAFRHRFSNYDGRVGGRGHLLGDQGSAYWIGQQALSTAFLAHDGLLTRPSEVALVNIAKDFYQVEEMVDLIPIVHDVSKGKTKVASFCERVMSEARDNESSQATHEIVVEAAEWLARMTSAVIPSNNQEDVHVVLLLVGSVWKSYDMLKEHFIERLILPTMESTIELLRLKKSAAYGCVDAAYRMFNGSDKIDKSDKSEEFKSATTVSTKIAAASAVEKIEIIKGLELLL
jgi:N-acetylglucosamine kinase-like BadF-type ATPase